MTTRAALPIEAVRITPGYSWRLDLDIKFDGERPNDWPDWVVRMHVWADNLGFTLTPGDGVSYQLVDGLQGGSAVIPVIVMDAARTETLRSVTSPIQYLIDLQAPGGSAEDYFYGAIAKLPSPPAGLIA